MKIYYPGQTVQHGKGTVDSDSTSGQLMKVTDDDTFEPLTVATEMPAGILLADRDKEAKATVVWGYGALIHLDTTEVAVTLVADDKVMGHSSGFFTKYAAGGGAVALGIVISAESGYDIKIYF